MRSSGRSVLACNSKAHDWKLVPQDGVAQTGTNDKATRYPHLACYWFSLVSPDKCERKTMITGHDRLLINSPSADKMMSLNYSTTKHIRNGLNIVPS